MMAYELPRTESGEVDFHAAMMSMAKLEYLVGGPWLEILKAIDANARAEERERCAKECDAYAIDGDGSGAIVAADLAHDFRNMVVVTNGEGNHPAAQAGQGVGGGAEPDGNQPTGDR